MTEITNSTSLQTFLPTIAGEPLTMSSAEIAEVCETRHNQVTETIARLFEKGVLRESRKTTRKLQPVGGGRPMNVYDLTKRDTLVVASGYNDELRGRIIDRWIELEASASKPAAIDFNSPQVLIGVLTALQSQLGEKDQVIAELGEKAKHLERIEGAYGSMCLTDAAKTLKKGPQELIRFMQARDMIYKRTGNTSWIGRQKYIGSGILEHKEHVYVGSDGVERVSTRVLVTGKGLVKLAEMLDSPLH